MDQTHKFDGGKLQYRLVPPHALKAVAEVLTFGAKKYSPYSWVNVESERYLDAAYRHLEQRRMGEELDQESGLTHLAHAAVNLLFLLERELNIEDAVGRQLYAFGEEVNKQNKR